MSDDLEVNVPLLRKAVEWAESEAAKPYALRQWDQGVYRVPPDMFHMEGLAKSPECGTAMCIAGFVGEQVRGDWRNDFGSDTAPDGTHIAEVARDALGLSDVQASALFWGDNSIADVRRIAEAIAGERL